MLSKEQNERVTRVGPGTPMGEVLRRFWMPVCLASEVSEPDGPPVRARLLGEDLVVFRDSRGEIGVLDSYCPHRRAPLFFGRNEEAGLRCVYHGWKFDTAGNCVDLPSEPPNSPLRAKVSIDAYPTWEGGGLIWAYMGPRKDVPETPDYEWLRAPGTHFRISRTNEACNWVQAVEGGIDTAHTSFAHNNDLSDTTQLNVRDTHPRLEVDVKPYGFTYAGIRDVGQEGEYVRGYQYIFPFQQMRGGKVNLDGTENPSPVVSGHLWVPMDDYSTAVYNFKVTGDISDPITDESWEKQEGRAGRGPEHYIPGTYWLKANPSNDYFVDREVQRRETFTGIEGINTQDFALQEGMGPICDRSKEHLGTSDKAIIQMRKLLLEAARAVEEGGAPPRGLDPADYRSVRSAAGIVPKGEDWRDTLKDGFTAYWG